MTATRPATLDAAPAAPAAPAAAGAGGRFASVNVERAAGGEFGAAGSAARDTPASSQGAVPVTSTVVRQNPNIPRRAA
ncbi:hypothetical protein ACFC01_31125 [Streptomyces mirabilis]|uniref:hypothetical protein n=1 Tax=Streptomyces TaxID=1883 RepID=UPI0011648557|nr:hypothetical protein [Streptomyces sp. S1A1-7]QDN82324.1 hypothetical protein FNV64_48310 [Streptomyces sp. S1A1-7]